MNIIEFHTKYYIPEIGFEKDDSSFILTEESLEEFDTDMKDRKLFQWVDLNDQDDIDYEFNSFPVYLKYFANGISDFVEAIKSGKIHHQQIVSYILSDNYHVDTTIADITKAIRSKSGYDAFRKTHIYASTYQFTKDRNIHYDAFNQLYYNIYDSDICNNSMYYKIGDVVSFIDTDGAQKTGVINFSSEPVVLDALQLPNYYYSKVYSIIVEDDEIENISHDRIISKHGTNIKRVKAFANKDHYYFSLQYKNYIAFL